MHKASALFSLVCAVSDLNVVREQLLASPELAISADDGPARAPAVHLVHGASSAAAAFNPVAQSHAMKPWLLWVHQDVYLPKGWLEGFAKGLQSALLRWPKLAVAGVYGIAKDAAVRDLDAGQVIDRGALLQGKLKPPCLVQSMDELLFAVRLDADLSLDAALGWDFYATDLVLTSQAKGWDAAVIDPLTEGAQPVEHWSTTPKTDISDVLGKRILRSGEQFLIKHQKEQEAIRLFHTPIVSMRDLNDLKAAIAACQEADRSEAHKAPARAKDRVDHDAIKLIREAIWLPSAKSLDCASAELQQGLRRFYRVAMLERIWHVVDAPSGGVSDDPLSVVAAIENTLASPWVICLPQPQLIIGDAFSTAQLPHRTKAQQTGHDLSLWQAIDAKTLAELERTSDPRWIKAQADGFPIPVYATGAGFEAYASIVKTWQAQAANHPLLCPQDAGTSSVGNPSLHESVHPAYPLHAAYYIVRLSDESRLGDLKGQRTQARGYTATPWVHRYDSYHQANREELIDWVPEDVKSVLDWGGGEGGFLLSLRKQRPELSLCLAEINRQCLLAGQSKGLETVCTDDEASLEGRRGTFDLVSLCDSLEHHSDPRRLLKTLRSLLRTQGLLLLSVPHVGFWPIVEDLKQGRFEYEAIGPLCETHLRFFSEVGLRRLLDDCAFEVLRWESIISKPPMTLAKDASYSDQALVACFLVLARRIG